MRRASWRIRTLMAIVAIGAASLACYEMWRRARTDRDRSDYHLAASRQLANEGRVFICGYGASIERVRADRDRRGAERTTIQAASEYHLRLHEKYRLASECPWRPVGPDPPPPPGGNPVLETADDY